MKIIPNMGYDFHDIFSDNIPIDHDLRPIGQFLSAVRAVHSARNSHDIDYLGASLFLKARLTQMLQSYGGEC